MDQVLVQSGSDLMENNYVFLYWLAVFILVPLSTFETM